MAALPQNLSAGPIFDFHTERLGRIVVDNFTAGDAMEIEEVIGQQKQNKPDELIETFILKMARTERGDHLTKTQVAELSEAEKEDFAEQLLTSEDHLYRELIGERSKDDKGNATIKYRKGEVTLPREPDESASQYFHRVYNAYREKQAARWNSTLGIAKGLGNWPYPRRLKHCTKMRG
jgi:hypothetical protein